jgi:MFS family permease
VAFNASISAISGLLDLPTGAWADRFGRRKIVALGFFCRALSGLLMILAPTPLGLVLAAVLAGFGWAQLSGAGEAFFHDNLAALGHARDFKHFMANVVMVNYTSRAIAFAMSGVLFSIHPTLPYYALVLATLSGLLLALTLSERPYQRAESQTNSAQIKEAAHIFWHTPYLLGLVGTIFVAHVSAEQLWYSFQPLLSQAGADARYSGFTYALASVGSVLGAFISKRFLKAHRDDLAIIFAVGLFGLGGLSFIFTTTSLGVAGSQILTCIGFGALWGSSSALLNAHIPSSHRATCLSLLSACETAAFGLIGCGVGYIFEHYGRAVVPLTVAIISAATIPCLRIVIKRLQSEAARP